MGFVNDYLTKEEQEMFRKRAIPNGANWIGGILGYEPYDLVPCTVDRENHVYLFDLGKYHDALDLDLCNFELVWDEMLGNIGVTFTMKHESIGEYVEGVGRDMIWKDFKLNLPYEFYSKRDAIVDKITYTATCSVCKIYNNINATAPKNAPNAASSFFPNLAANEFTKTDNTKITPLPINELSDSITVLLK